MKKRNLKSLALNKKSISILKPESIKGGRPAPLASDSPTYCQTCK
ncbi:hypothetical protein [Kordia sp.]